MNNPFIQTHFGFVNKGVKYGLSQSFGHFKKASNSVSIQADAFCSFAGQCLMPFDLF